MKRGIANRLMAIELRLEKLECAHPKESIRFDFVHNGSFISSFRKVCGKCGMILETYGTKQEWTGAQIKEKLKELKKLRAERSRMDKNE